MSGRIPVEEMVRYAATRQPQQVAPSDLWRDGRDLSRWNTSGGSQNTFPVAHTAAGDWRWVVEQARRWRLEGLWGRELGAPGFYFVAPLAAMVVALRDASDAGDASAVSDLGDALRAAWAWEALTAVAWPRTSSRVVFGRVGQPQEFRGPGEAAWYLGPTTATAGDRWNLRSAEGVAGQPPKPGGFPDHDPHGWLLAWALDWPGRRDSNNSSTRLRKQDVGPQNAIAHIAGVDRYDRPTAPSVWGLTEPLRNDLVAVVRGGDPQAALDLLAVVPPRQGYRRTVRRTEQGVEHVAHNTRNGNKPTLAYARVDAAGAWVGMRPCHHRGTGANKGLDVTVAPDHVAARCGEGESARVDRLGGSELWRLEVDDGRLEIHRGGEGGVVAPPPPPSPSPPDPPAPPPGGGNDPGGPAGWLGSPQAPARHVLRLEDPVTGQPRPPLIVETRGTGQPMIVIRER
jgi:hypothetical protein